MNKQTVLLLDKILSITGVVITPVIDRSVHHASNNNCNTHLGCTYLPEVYMMLIPFFNVITIMVSENNKRFSL